MTVYIIGHSRTAFTVGMSRCEERNANLPFFAFGPSDQIAKELQMAESSRVLTEQGDVSTAVDAFIKHGTVIFIDNSVACERMIEMIDTVLTMSEATDWINRTPIRETMQ